MEKTEINLTLIIAICIIIFISAGVVQADMQYPDAFVSSTAFGIDSSGNIAGYAVDNNGSEFAVIWRPVPEPGTFLLLAIGTVFLFRSRELREKKFDSKD